MGTFSPVAQANRPSLMEQALEKTADALGRVCNTTLTCIKTGDEFSGWIETEEIPLLTDAGPDEVIDCTLCVQPCNMPKLGLPCGKKFTDGTGAVYLIEKRRADKNGCHRYRLSVCKQC